MRYEPLNFEYIRSSGGRVLENLLESVGNLGLGGGAAATGGYTGGALGKSASDTAAAAGRSGKSLPPAPRSMGMRIPQAALREVYRINGML